MPRYKPKYVYTLLSFLCYFLNLTFEFIGGCNIEGEEDGWDFGTGAGFYVDATEDKWKMNYRMFSYVTKELPLLISSNFPADQSLMSIMGHRYKRELLNGESFHIAFFYSMGGHGALICALKNPGLYKSVSAFAPICNPVNCPWGEKAFSGYLGSDRNLWKEWDASCLAATYQGPPLQIFVDQVMLFKMCLSCV